MAISKAQQKAVNKYISNNYDRLYIFVDKGKKDIIKQYAKKHNESVNQYINIAIDNRISIEENQLPDKNTLID